ncbi:hypothetical protein Alg130_12154, partial [Pyrenophora tritici-repentis]
TVHLATMSSFACHLSSSGGGIPQLALQAARDRRISTQLATKNPTPILQAGGNLHPRASLAHTPLPAALRRVRVPIEDKVDSIALKTAY